VVHNNVLVVNNRYRSPNPYYRPRPPVYGRPVYARPPTNWYARPGYRPPPAGYRAYGPNYPGYRAGMPAGYRPPPPAGGYRATPPPNAGTYRNEAGNVGATRSATPAPGNVGATRPATTSGNLGSTRNQANNPAATQHPQPERGNHEGAFAESNHGKEERQASQRGRASSGEHAGGRRR